MIFVLLILFVFIVKFVYTENVENWKINLRVCIGWEKIWNQNENGNVQCFKYTSGEFSKLDSRIRISRFTFVFVFGDGRENIYSGAMHKITRKRKVKKKNERTSLEPIRT